MRIPGLAGHEERVAARHRAPPGRHWARAPLRPARQPHDHPARRPDAAVGDGVRAHGPDGLRRAQGRGRRASSDSSDRAASRSVRCPPRPSSCAPTRATCPVSSASRATTPRRPRRRPRWCPTRSWPWTPASRSKAEAEAAGVADRHAGDLRCRGSSSWPTGASPGPPSMTGPGAPRCSRSPRRAATGHGPHAPPRLVGAGGAQPAGRPARGDGARPGHRHRRST